MINNFPQKPSAYGRETSLRFTATAARPFLEHMRSDSSQEQLAFGLASHATTAQGTTFLVNEILVPDRDDLAEQSAVSVCPTPAFQAFVYYRADQTRKSIVEFHTHPGSHAPEFSGVDEMHARPNARYITANLPDPVTLLMVVGNNRFDAFQGMVYDRYAQEFVSLDRLEILGKSNRTWTISDAQTGAATQHQDAFDRQKRIPGWDQDGLERQRVGIFGAGGNGAVLFQNLVSIGVGRKGFVAIADDDLIEPSNLPRIPYACSDQVGTPKVAAAVRYAAAKSPATPIYAFPCRFSEQPVLARMKMATVLFFAGDSDGGRKEANEFCVRYGIPLIDLGCDIQVNDDQVVAGGQVRLVLPGENACLVCCRGYDASQAAIDLMSPQIRAMHSAQGYVRGALATATPSVVNLNGLTVQHAISQLLALVHGSSFCTWDYLHFDAFSGITIPAKTKRLANCPLCGSAGRLTEGDALPPRQKDTITADKPKSGRPRRLPAKQSKATTKAATRSPRNRRKA